MTLDVMPNDPTILGFGNPWYTKGFAHVQPYTLPNEAIIRVISPVYSICTKLVALGDRERADLRVIQDLENIVHLVDNGAELTAKLVQALGAVRVYVRRQAHELLVHPAFSKPFLGPFIRQIIPISKRYTSDCAN